MSNIGNYLQKIREEQDISIRHLSRISGVSHSEINKIENGERTVPSAMHLKLIATALGINQIECLKIAALWLLHLNLTLHRFYTLMRCIAAVRISEL